MASRSNESRLATHYGSLQKRWNVQERLELYGRLVTASDNSGAPIHGWFPFKEGFSKNLVPTILSEDRIGIPTTFLDPFAGSGTSLISLIQDHPGEVQNVIGWEVNPLIATIARAKLAGVVATVESVLATKSAIERVRIVLADHLRREFSTESSTLNNVNYFAASDLHGLLALSSAIRAEVIGPAQDILMACLAATVEPSSRLRRDGRALRYTAGKIPVDPLKSFWDRSSAFVLDMEGSAQRGVKGPRVDFRTTSAIHEVAPPGSIDLAVFSPPYPNNIDYTEVYKAEAWVAGMYANNMDVREQRHKSLRSHPSVRFAEKYAYPAAPNVEQYDSLIAPVLDAVPSGRYSMQRLRTIKGYTDDMNSVLANVSASLRPGGDVYCVVANSRHGHGEAAFEVASDLIIARLGELNGFDVVSLSVARYPKRRVSSTGLLRETVIRFRKPIT